MVLIGLLLFLLLRPDHRAEHGPEQSLGRELLSGSWLVAYLLVLTLLSWLGSFKGSGHLAAPFDSITVALVSAAVFAWAVRAGRSLPSL
jgi:hypothetical protein